MCISDVADELRSLALPVQRIEELFGLLHALEVLVTLNDQRRSFHTSGLKDRTILDVSLGIPPERPAEALLSRLQHLWRCHHGVRVCPRSIPSAEGAAVADLVALRSHRYRGTEALRASDQGQRRPAAEALAHHRDARRVHDA